MRAPASGALEHHEGAGQIAGRRLGGSGGRGGGGTCDVLAPSTGDVLVAVADSDTADADRALAALPADQRRTWVLKEFGDYGYAEIARDLDLPISTVRGLLARARRTLMRELEEWR